MLIDLLSLATYTFTAGVLGLLFYQRNFIILLLAFELILLGLSSYFIFFSLYLPNIYGQITALILLTLAGTESALGLALIMVMYRVTGSINLRLLVNLKN